MPSCPPALAAKIGIKGGAQIAHMHVAGGARRKSGAGMAVINHCLILHGRYSGVNLRGYPPDVTTLY